MDKRVTAHYGGNASLANAAPDHDRAERLGQD
jgi:hypothetical protein